ncbi:hypothetical protein [Sphaerisporangium sp. TRM90804]|uniref:hypothetical protein n=1 Tax=Sphaerisporangium sp. TRM90804 TaxID=3031113 RepID=UPI00244729F9|nr:hypothetical protein [Sphaerisporangium sp. TRM90804]MDH2428618.1 hypothetical protein [Sphaerisporangium sp. TRM90804]
MSMEKEIGRDTGGRAATALGERPERGAAAPATTRRRAAPAPPRPVRRAPARPAAKPAGGGVRPPSTPRNAPRAPFVLLVVGLLCGGLVSLLLLNTVLAKDSFRMNDLRDSTKRLHQQAQDMNKSLLIKSQPGEIARRAANPTFKPDDAAPVFIDPAKGLTTRPQSRVVTPTGGAAQAGGEGSRARENASATGGDTSQAEVSPR